MGPVACAYVPVEAALACGRLIPDAPAPNTPAPDALAPAAAAPGALAPAPVTPPPDALPPERIAATIPALAGERAAGGALDVAADVGVSAPAGGGVMGAPVGIATIGVGAV